MATLSEKLAAAMPYIAPTAAKWGLRAAGHSIGPMGWLTMGDGRPDNSLSDMQALTRAYAEARAKRAGSLAGSPSPAGPVVDESAGLNTAARPQAPGAMPWWADGRAFGAPAAPQAAAPAPQVSSVPMPQPRPDAAPEALASQPDTGFFMRNALMMQDPSTGAMIDPAGAQRVRGPDLISKMMSYLHGKMDT